MEYNHEEDYCGDYCRCGKIVGIEPGKPNSFRIASAIAKSYNKKLSTIKEYAIERWANMLTHDDFDIKSTGGYYGEEVDSITLKTRACDELYRLLESDDPIDFMLNLEYPGIPNPHRGKKWELQTSTKISLIDPSINAKLNKTTLEYYKTKLTYGMKRFTILCIAKSGGRFGLIDGRHRLEALIKNKQRLVDVIYCK